MRSKTILAILFLFSIGLAAMLFIRALPHDSSAAASPAVIVVKDEILVAATPLAGATLLRAQDVKWSPRAAEAQPGEIVRPSVETRSAKPESDEAARAAVYGAALRGALAEGTPLVAAAIVKPGDRDFLHTVLTPGTRAISVPVSVGAGSTGLMFPGDYVDVILTQSFKNDAAPLTRRSVSETVVENRRVLAIETPKAQAASSGLTVTLEVAPEQAEKINVAQELGKLSLTLRSLSDASGAAAVGAAVRPTWAGDVSPALGAATPPPKVLQAERPSIKVMRGNKTEDIKPQ
jgi:pilus assembly protein CpaB